MMSRLVAAATFALLIATASHAAVVEYSLNFTGAQEAPGPGDTDGIGFGTLTVNDGTGDIAWNFNYFNIATPTAMHIHTGTAGNSGGVLVGLGTTGDGTSTLADSTSTSAANALAITSDPTSYYVNIHNAEFSGGAIRAQIVPEPSSYMLLAFACLVLAVRRNRRKS